MYLTLIFPFVLLSYIFNGIFKVDPLKTSTTGRSFSLLPNTDSVLFVGFVILTVGATVSVTLKVFGTIFLAGV